MTEPLNETPRLNAKELFTKAAVERFQEKVSDIERSDLRHYNQLITHFDDKAIHAALSKFQIPIEARVTVYGGLHRSIRGIPEKNRDEGYFYRRYGRVGRAD